MNDTNLEKEIFNQYLVDFMEDEMLTPENEFGYLETPPSTMSIPGTLLPGNIEKSIPTSNFKISLKTREDIETEFSISGSFYLYYKEYPKFSNLKKSYDFKNLINNNIKDIKNKIRKKIKNNATSEDINYSEIEKLTNFELKKHLNKLYNNNSNILIDIMIDKIILFLTYEPDSIKKSNDERLNFLDNSLEDTEDNFLYERFLFNEEDFKTIEDYKKLISLLKNNNYELYNKFFSQIPINFNYKKIKIEIPIIKKEANETVNDYNIKINYIINNCTKEQLSNFTLNNNIIIPNKNKIHFFDYLDQASYDSFLKKDSHQINKVETISPQITVFKDGNNLLFHSSYSHENINYNSWLEIGIYNLNLTLCLNVNHLCEYKYNANQHYKYNYTKKIYAISENVGLAQDVNESTLILNTTFNPKYYLPRNSNREVSKDILTYSSWEISKNRSVSELYEITRSYEKWIENIPDHIKKENGYINDFNKWQVEIQSINNGIKILDYAQKSSLNSSLSCLYKAWCFVNESFSLIDMKYNTWRLFQLSFLLNLIPSFTLQNVIIKNKLIDEGLFTRDETDVILNKSKEQINLLYFNAGGGKTEAFLSILLFNLFLDRMTNKKCGLTAIIKYPLRLLLMQQTERVLKTLCSAEKIRRKYNLATKEDFFEHSFSLGIWVGSSSTPNKIKDVKNILELKNDCDLSLNNTFNLSVENQKIKHILMNEFDDEQNEQLISFNKQSLSLIPETIQELRELNGYEENGQISGYQKISKCPFCESKDITLRKYQNSLVHICLNKKCDWNCYYNSYHPLPFYIIDDDIYSRYPSVVISTTDKLARFGFVRASTKKIPDNRHVLGMFGIAPYYDASSKKLLWEIDKNTKYLKTFMLDDKSSIFINGFPSMVIQDETHLLIESLGSFSAIFERNFTAVLSEINNIINKKYKKSITIIDSPIIIAATATIASPEKQLCPIYGKKNVSIFPALGYKIYENFYSIPELKDSSCVSLNEEECYKISRIYNGMFLNSINYYESVKRYSIIFHAKINDLYNNGITKEKMLNTIKNSFYKKEFLNSINNYPVESYKEYIKRNSMLNKILINYTGSKNMNDKLKSLELSIFEKNLYINQEYLGQNIISEQNQVSITSDVDQDKLQEILFTIKEQANTPLDYNKSHNIIKSIFATQSISHGVDSDMFNGMIFHGIPEFINEYIQASARIGRTNVGFVTCFPNGSNKDFLIMNNFEAFHRFVERPVLANKIDFSTKKIITRAIMSLFISWFINIYLLEKNWMDIEKSNIENINKEIFNHQIILSSLKPKFLAYLSLIFDKNAEEMLDKEVSELLSDKINSLFDIKSNKYSMMTSLRDTEENIDIYIG